MNKRRVKFAPSDGIEQFGPLCDEFLARIFDVHGAFVSDESTMADFAEHLWAKDATPEQQRAHFLNQMEAVCRKIQAEFGVDATKCRYIIDVLRLIHADRTNRGRA